MGRRESRLHLLPELCQARDLRLALSAPQPAEQAAQLAAARSELARASISVRSLKVQADLKVSAEALGARSERRGVQKERMFLSRSALQRSVTAPMALGQPVERTFRLQTA
jgi:hypothetical protein